MTTTPFPQPHYAPQTIRDRIARAFVTFLRFFADAFFARRYRHGAVVLNGEREVVAGIVLMLRGGNARQVVEAVKTKVDDIQQNNIRLQLLGKGKNLTAISSFC